ncbi:uncharacterized protein F5147DRAFT_658414 [Suillus discolor]|uniref:Uncharacterized protein n=1 Tax=Suillus discolor TaxID=1912936 RepID=A0A9P7JMU1_9AGAM|nr:uncharacterized protein F5147DRAFT_658414 [Suillus discolor]KAG2089465.1 hypothetical protein F5147DRAFT_658414 [Suillus discolor]
MSHQYLYMGVSTSVALDQMNLTPTENTNKCRILINIYSCFFALRTYALWDNNRIVLLGLLSTAFVMVVTSVGIRFTIIATSNITTSTIPGIQGCSWSPSGVLYLMLFIFLFVFQLGLVSLTLIRVIQSWRSSKGHLYAALVKHNIFYYTCGLLFSAINVIMPVLFPNSAYYIVLEDLQHMRDSDAVICTSMFDMSPADLMV